MNARGKKVLTTLFAVFITAVAPTGCAVQAVPGIIGGGSVGPMSGAGGAAAGAGGAGGANSGMLRGGIPAASEAGAGGAVPP